MTDMAEEAKEMEPKEEAGKKKKTQAEEKTPMPLSEEGLKDISGGTALVSGATATTFA